ncbi:MAG: DUF4159 domain-containing protein [Gemmatimonadota bacterium]
MKLRRWGALATVLLLCAWATAPLTTNELTIAQLQYGGGGDWYANPSGLPNLLKVIRERTGLQVSDRPGKVKPTDPTLWNYPYIYVTGHGNIKFTDEEVQILRRYLQSGGFMHVDDNYGLDKSFRRELTRIFPDKELAELPSDHPIYKSFYSFPTGLPKVHLHDGKAARGYGVFHQGRLIVYYTYETDLGNGWEDADRYEDPPEAREAAFRMGVNIFVYALSQAVAQ